MSACRVPVTVILADQEATKLPTTTNRFGQRNRVETRRHHATETSYGDTPITKIEGHRPSPVDAVSTRRRNGGQVRPSFGQARPSRSRPLVQLFQYATPLGGVVLSGNYKIRASAVTVTLPFRLVSVFMC